MAKRRAKLHKFFVSGDGWALIWGVISCDVRYRLDDRKWAALRQSLHAVLLDFRPNQFRFQSSSVRRY